MTPEDAVVEFKGYERFGGEWATREKKKGRPKEGTQAYLRNRAKVPMQKTRERSA